MAILEMNKDAMSNNAAAQSGVKLEKLLNIADLTNVQHQASAGFALLNNLSERFIENNREFIGNYLYNYKIYNEKAVFLGDIFGIWEEIQQYDSERRRENGAKDGRKDDFNDENMLFFSFHEKKFINSNCGYFIAPISLIFSSIEQIFGHKNLADDASKKAFEDVSKNKDEMRENKNNLTNLERNHAINFVNNIINGITEGLHSLCPLSFTKTTIHNFDGKLENNSMKNRKFYIFNMKISINNVFFPIYLLLPEEWLVSIKAALTQDLLKLESRNNSEWSEYVRDFLVDLELSLQAKIGGFRASLKDLIHLSEGDVLLFDNNLVDGVMLQVANTTVGCGELGRWRNNLAVSVQNMG
jgi:flagellar motor switch/type III secretory pathway protein FliN